MQPPAASLHASSVQPMPSSQRGRGPGWHTPSTQTSTPSQMNPSSHSASVVQPTGSHPVGITHIEPGGQRAGSIVDSQPRLDSTQRSTVQETPSSQKTGSPAVQVPAKQVSSPLQKKPSSQSPSAVHPMGESMAVSTMESRRDGPPSSKVSRLLRPQPSARRRSRAAKPPLMREVVMRTRMPFRPDTGHGQCRSDRVPARKGS